jgi:hypothetical protein
MDLVRFENHGSSNTICPEASSVHVQNRGPSCSGCERGKKEYSVKVKTSMPSSIPGVP